MGNDAISLFLTDKCNPGATIGACADSPNGEICAIYCEERRKSHEFYALLCSFMLGSLLVLSFLENAHLQTQILVAMFCSLLGTFCHVFMAQMWGKLPTAKPIRIEHPIIDGWVGDHSPIFEKAFIIPFIIIEYFGRVSPYATIGVLWISMCIWYPMAIGVPWVRYVCLSTAVLFSWVFILYLAAMRWLWTDEIKSKND